MERRIRGILIVLVGIIFVVTLTACSQSTYEPTSPLINVPSVITPTIEIKPDEPPEPEQEFTDVNSWEFQQDKSVLGGESYITNFFERPFTTEMVYLPDVDILKAAIATDTDFLYFTITLHGSNTDSGDLQAQYGIELDVDKDGRGDYSIWALHPTSTSWTTSDLTILTDTNNDVGGLDPALGETGWHGDGYETAISNSNPEAAWVRISLTDPVVVQLAVLRTLFDEPTEFLWGVWADNGLKNPRQFDYNDFYTFKEAGSGYAESPFYPLKIVNSNDNTCRQAYGFVPNDKIPNLCLYTPVATPVAGPSIDCSQFQPPCPAGCMVPVGGQGICVPAP
jgi:hypothetical protein